MNTCFHCDAALSNTEIEYCTKCKTKIEARLAYFKTIEPTKMGVGRAIIIWPFEEAPTVFQEMSDNGGDEDWIALIPPNITWIPMWLESLDTCLEPQQYEIAEGFKVMIGSHS